MRLLPFIGLLLVVVLAPLPLGSNRPGPWSFLAIWIGLLLIAWGFAMWRDWTHLHVRLPYWRMPLLAFCAVLAWALLQAMPWTPGFLHHWMWEAADSATGGRAMGAISAAPLETLTGITRLAAYAGVFFLAMQYGRNRQGARQLVAAIAISVLAYAAYGLSVHFSGNDTILWFQKWAYPNSLTSTFVNRNSFATYCSIGLVVLFATLLGGMRHRDAREPQARDRRIMQSATILAAILVLFTALLLTRSRGGLLSTLVGLAVVFALNHGFSLRSTRLMPAPGSRLWIALAGGTVLIVLLVSGGAVMDRVGSDQAGFGRTGIWARTVSAIADAPLRGHGLGAYETVFPAYQDEPHVFANPVDKAHNTYLEVVTELGLPFGLLLIAIPFWICWQILRGYSRQLGGRYAIIALGASAVVGVHSLVDFSAQIPAVTIVWLALLGTGFAQSLPPGISSIAFVRSVSEDEAGPPAAPPPNFR